MTTHDDPQDPAFTLLAQQRLCVVGLGLMGGSFALALRDRVGSLDGVDSSETTLERARERAVPGLLTSDIERGVAGSTVVVLATPVRTNLDLIAQIGPKLPHGALLIDLSSTKLEVVSAMNRLPAHVRAIGGHPMCGKERAGIEHAQASLFRRQTFALCRTRRTDTAAEALALALVQALEAAPLWIDPADHDRAVAKVSHLPYLLAASLVQSTADLSAESMRLAASGYRDTSRLAASDPEMMTDVLLTNRQPILDALGAARGQLDQLFELIRSGHAEQLRQRAAMAQNRRKEWKQTNPTRPEDRED